MCTWIWLTSEIPKGPVLRQYRDSLIQNVSRYQNVKEFLRGEKEPTEITSWDGQVCGYFSYDKVKALVRQINILGPLAAIYGRDIEQEIMYPTSGTLISARKFNQSTNVPSTTLEATNLGQRPNEVRDHRSEAESTRETSHRPRRD